MKSKTRQILSTVALISILSFLIGGFAIWGSYTSEISIIENQLNIVVNDVKLSSDDPLTSALFSVSQNNFDMTVAFQSSTGEIAILKQSKKAVLGTTTKLKTRTIRLQAGEKLLIATSVVDIDKNLTRNLWRLLIFFLFANVIASFISLSISRSGALAIERAHREKMQEFLGDAAHELRTPLTVVKGYAELLKNKALDSERETSAFERLNVEIQRMESLIADLLILAELGEEEPIEFSEVNLSELVSENVRDFQVIAPQHHLELDLEAGVTIQGSEKYLQRFIANALTNIRVHTDASAPVRVTLKAGREIKLVVEDGGAGLPETSYGERIQGLKRFDRSRSRVTGGSGLGMSIMSAVIERHGGTLALKKSDLGGLAIEVQLART
ncbi:MAG: histidine kinase dimerization/phospho-acceptor domain-containing protein [Candidatus Planktophila sp.]|nr:histidine kinase dimerization/phospho-acceptor domain-containing protein [Candidatus Planktophila sp.]